MSRTEALAILALVGGCGRPVGIEGIEAVASPDVPVVTVTWTTSEAVTSRVAFGADDAFDLASPAEAAPSTDHRAVLVGVPAGADVSFRIEAGEATSDPQTVTMPAAPAELPPATATGEGNDAFLLLSATGDVNWVLMYDPAGRLVWWHRDDRGLSVFRARAARDGSGIVYGSVIQGGGPSADSEIVRVPWDGSTESTIPVPDLAHDFVELPDGTVQSLAYQTVDGVLGNDVLAIAPDGGVTEVWSAWDCFDPVANPGDDPDHGWTHTNALDRDDETGELLVGMRNLATIARVDPTTRTCPWALGGSGGTLTVDGARFIHEHQFEQLGDEGMLVFDNDGAPGNVSRAIEYALDLDAGTASEVRTFEADPPLYSFILGDVHRFADGDTLVEYAVPATLDRVDASGARTFRLEIASEGPLGFVTASASPYGD